MASIGHAPPIGKVNGIGFDESEDFPIKRKDFARLQVALLPREDAPDE
jgi:hypothetical protein